MEDDLQRESTQGEVLDELASLRAQSLEDAAEIARLQSEAQESHRIERAQRALIAHLRHDVSEADERLEQVRDRLAGAESELDDLRAIRDALSSPALLQRADLTLAADLIPASSHVGGDFFFVGDGPGGAVVAIIGDVVGHGLPAARRAAFARTAFASLTPFSDDPCRLLELVTWRWSSGSARAPTSSPLPASPTTRAAEPCEPPPQDIHRRYAWIQAAS